MNDDNTIQRLDKHEISQVAGGIIPIAAVIALYVGAFGGGAGFGYMVGRDRAIRDNGR